jgi:TRAP-type C4-dicarboxylate transport system substrate-binding protein
MQATKELKHPLAMSDKEWEALPQERKDTVLKNWEGMSQKEREEALAATRKYKKSWWLSKDPRIVAKYQKSETVWLAVHFDKESLDKKVLEAERDEEERKAMSSTYLCFDMMRNK